eukprot:1294886-Amphidinium_carterae.1
MRWPSLPGQLEHGQDCAFSTRCLALSASTLVIDCSNNICWCKQHSVKRGVIGATCERAARPIHSTPLFFSDSRKNKMRQYA